MYLLFTEECHFKNICLFEVAKVDFDSQETKLMILLEMTLNRQILIEIPNIPY